MKIIIILLLLLSGCKATKEDGNSSTTHFSITDPSGRTVIIKHPINRIISTAPSNTEIITDLGMAHKLVAIDRHSANVKAPAKYQSPIRCPEIPDGIPLLDFFFPDAEVIINLEPDIIIASGHNPTGTGEDPFQLLREAGIPVAYISMSKNIDDIYRDIAFIAEILSAQKNGEELILSMKEQIAQITQKAALIETKKTVYFEISAAPQMFTFGKDSFINDMISTIGARNIFENENWLVSPSAEAIIDRNPDVILTNVDYIPDPIGELKSRPGFNHISAIANDRIYQIDTDSSVRSSSRIILAMRQMAYAVYPEVYDNQ